MRENDGEVFGGEDEEEAFCTPIVGTGVEMPRRG